MIDILKGYLDKDWKTKDEILYFINHFYKEQMNERSLREYFAKFNERYESGETEMFIAHSAKGYLLTSDAKTIMSSLEDDHKRAIKLLRRYFRCKKSLSEKDQLTLSPSEENLYEVIMKLEN